MKKILNFRKILLLAIIALVSISCDDNDDDMTPQTPDTTITSLAVATPDLSILVQALIKADLATTLEGNGPFTVSAPTNDAFAEFLMANGFKSLDEVPTAALKQILLNHVVSGNVKSTDLTTGYVKTLATSSTSGSNTMSMYVDLTSGVKLNGVSSVTTADIMASNGVIHIVNSVIGLPTIVTHAAANPNFTTLVSVVTNPAQASILTALSSPGPLTVFAPTNGGFSKLNNDLIGLGVAGGISGVSQATISNVLLYHVVSGNVLASSLTSGNVSTLLEQNFEVQLTGGAKIIDNNDRTSNIIITDVQCSNGVIHAIDNALLPSL